MPALPPLPSLPRPPMLAELLPGSLRQRMTEQLSGLRIPAFTVPAPVAKLVSRLPQQPPTRLLTLALNLALDRILPRDTLAPLSGRHLQMRVLDAGLLVRSVAGDSGEPSRPWLWPALCAVTLHAAYHLLVAWRTPVCCIRSNTLRHSAIKSCSRAVLPATNSPPKWVSTWGAPSGQSSS